MVATLTAEAYPTYHTATGRNPTTFSHSQDMFSTKTNKQTKLVFSSSFSKQNQEHSKVWTNQPLTDSKLTLVHSATQNLQTQRSEWKYLLFWNATQCFVSISISAAAARTTTTKYVWASSSSLLTSSSSSSFASSFTLLLPSPLPHPSLF